VAPVIVGAKISVAMAVVMIVPAAIIVVPSRNEHAASERGGEDSKNEYVFHVCFSFENDQLDQDSALFPESLVGGKIGTHTLFNHRLLMLVGAASYIAGD
jgi:hypothetical protein